MHVLSHLHEENGKPCILTDRYSLIASYPGVEKQFFDYFLPDGRLLFPHCVLKSPNNVFGKVVVCFYEKLFNCVPYSIDLYFSHRLLLIPIGFHRYAL